MNASILTLAIAALTASTAVGQVVINPNVGAPQGATDDSVSGPLTCSFPIVFPGGNSVTDIFVDSNGRILSAIDGSDFSESTAEFLGDPFETLAPYWDDLNPVGGASLGDVFFNDLGTSILVTWQDTVLFGGAAGTEFTIQAELFPGGVFKFRADGRAPLANDGIVGVSAGNGAIDPGSSDLSAGVMSAGVATVYEQFLGLDNSQIGAELCFTPDGSGGYNVTFMGATVSVVVTNGPACTASASIQDNLTFTPDGMGGYNVSTAGAADMTFASGTALGLTDDSTSVQPLGFNFTMPGGAVVTDIEIDSNGRIFQAGLEFSDFSESVTEFLGDATAIIAPYWDDFNPASGGEVWFNVTASGVSVTWDGVPEFVNVGANTFQAQLSPSGVISFHYLSMESLDGIVGLSSGNGALDPGPVDLSAGGIATAGNPVVYQQFTGDNDLGIFTPPTLEALSNPVIGTSFDLLISSPTPTIGEFYLLGNAFSFDLSPLGINCTLLTDSVLGTLSGVTGVANSVAIPNLPGLVGASLVAQGATLDLTAGNPFFVLFTNSIDFTFGDI